MKWLEKYADHTYALLRIVAGLLFVFHGFQKLFGVAGGFRPPVGSQIWIGGVLELVGGLAILVGFQTRLAAFVLSGMMAVAYTQFHWKFQLGAAFWPAVNQGEPAVVFCFLFLFMAARGGVKWCVDQVG
ncbi:DoxX family protein [Geothrix oryzisoli]|uniref:DoxX family protein n=1 Tax=Geothrix oryzisoli TaxID=2922721 RepID=UPI001FACE57F|nr:DoxX family protein [Geothrix oryzisoli]